MQETHVDNKLRELRKARGLSQEEVARGGGHDKADDHFD